MDIDESLNTINIGADAQQVRLAYEYLIQAKIQNPEIIQVFASGLVNTDRGIRDICSRGLMETSEELHIDCANYVAPLIAHNDIEIRNLAGEILTTLQKSSINSLIPFLNNASEDVRKFACDILGLIGHVNILKDIYPLLIDIDSNVRNSAIEAIGNICEKEIDDEFDFSEAVDGLINLYNYDENAKPQIIDSLSKIKCTEAEEFLIYLITNEDDLFLQTAAIDALAVCGNSISVCNELLVKLPLQAPELQVIILKTIFAVSYRLGMTIELPDNLRYVALNALMDDDPDIRAAGLISLGANYVINDIDYILNEMNSNNFETSQHIILNVSISDNIDFIKTFYSKYLRVILLKDLDGNTFDFVALLTNVWEYVSDNNKLIIIEEVVKFSFIDAKGYELVIIELLLKLDRIDVISVLNSLLNSEEEFLRYSAKNVIEQLDLND